MTHTSNNADRPSVGTAQSARSLTITVIEHTPTCVACGTYLRLSRSVAAGACCCCRVDHATDYYVDLPLPEPDTWQATA